MYSTNNCIKFFPHVFYYIEQVSILPVAPQPTVPDASVYNDIQSDVFLDCKNNRPMTVRKLTAKLCLGKLPW